MVKASGGGGRGGRSGGGGSFKITSEEQIKSSSPFGGSITLMQAANGKWTSDKTMYIGGRPVSMKGMDIGPNTPGYEGQKWYKTKEEARAAAEPKPFRR